jgi:hypothetical protein
VVLEHQGTDHAHALAQRARGRGGHQGLAAQQAMGVAPAQADAGDAGPFHETQGLLAGSFAHVVVDAAAGGKAIGCGAHSVAISSGAAVLS